MVWIKRLDVEANGERSRMFSVIVGGIAPVEASRERLPDLPMVLASG